MKILILFTSSELGGAERSLSRMALSDDSTLDYRLGTLDGEGMWSNWIDAQGAVPNIFGTGGVSVARALRRVIDYVRREDIAIVYICGARLALWLRFLRMMTPGVRYVHAVRWNPASNNRQDWFFRTVERFSSRLMDAWIANSEAARTTMIERCGIDPERVHVIHNGLDLVPRNVPRIEERPLMALTVANLNPRKGHIEYLDLIPRIVEKVPGAQFVFVGRDDMAGAFQRAIRDRGLGAHVTYAGFQDDVNPWLAQARVFVLPSLWAEGSPTSILEAFAYRIPVVCHDIDGLPELVTDGVDGRLFPAGDPGIADAITELLLTPDLAEEMGAAGQEKVSRHFTLAACVARHETVLRQIVE